MGTYVQQVPVRFKSYTVTTAADVYEDVQGFPFPLTITAIPSGGGTISVYYSTTPNAAGQPGSATWIAWPSGSVSNTTSDALMSPVAGLRFSVNTSTGTVEVNA